MPCAVRYNAGVLVINAKRAVLSYSLSKEREAARHVGVASTFYLRPTYVHFLVQSVREVSQVKDPRCNIHMEFCDCYRMLACFPNRY